MAMKNSRGPVFLIVHKTGKETRVRCGDFFDHLKAGNLLKQQTESRDGRKVFTAHIHPGLMAYVDESQQPKRLVLELDTKATFEEIESRLVEEFSYPTEEARRIADELGRLCSARRTYLILASLGLRLSFEAKNTWRDMVVRHLIESGFSSQREVEENMLQSRPRLKSEPVIEGDPETAFVLY